MRKKPRRRKVTWMQMRFRILKAQNAKITAFLDFVKFSMHLAIIVAQIGFYIR